LDLLSSSSFAEGEEREMQSLSMRSTRAQSPGLPYWSLFSEALKNLHSEENEKGVVAMVVAENSLSAADVADRLKEVSSVALCTPGQMGYDDMRGRSSLRRSFQIVAEKFITSGAPVSPFNLCVGNGCGTLIQHLAHLLCDPSDCMLLATPTYGMLYNDVGVLAGVEVIDVPLIAGSCLSTEALDEACNRATARGLRPRLLFVINPENPLGIVRGREEMKSVLSWVRTKPDIHLVSDEIYALSVYDEEEGEPFKSMASICYEESRGTSSIDVYLGDRVHILWGFSKDFCASGLRVGVLFSHNVSLLGALDNVGYFSAASNHTQDTLALALVGGEVSGSYHSLTWLEGYLARNRARLREARDLVMISLAKLRVGMIKPRAGLFIWIDLSPWLTESTWAGERAFTQKLFQEGVLLTPGEAAHAASPGFFRLCFAWHSSIESISVGIKRLVNFLEKIRERK